KISTRKGPENRAHKAPSERGAPALRGAAAEGDRGKAGGLRAGARQIQRRGSFNLRRVRRLTNISPCLPPGPNQNLEHGQNALGTAGGLSRNWRRRLASRTRQWNSGTAH